MEAKKIEVVKDWPKPKLVRNIQIFLEFANFYWQFIQSFSRIATPLTSILKTSGLSDKPAPSRNNSSRSASSKNNNSRIALGKNDGNSEVDKFGVSDEGVEHTKKSKKSKKQKLAKSQKLSKSRKSKGKKLKKPSKSKNSPNFNVTEAKPNVLIPGTKKAFNCLWLAFIKALIF